MCDMCNDRGYIVDDNNKMKKCVCTVKTELSVILGELLKYKLHKDINIKEVKKDLTIIDGNTDTFKSLVKSFLFKLYFNENINKLSYLDCTAYHIVEHYLNSEIDFIYNVPYLFIDFTQYCSNKLLGETILYVIQQRKSKSLLTWAYVGSFSSDKITSVYSAQLLELLLTQKTISLKFLG